MDRGVIIGGLLISASFLTAVLLLDSSAESRRRACAEAQMRAEQSAQPSAQDGEPSANAKKPAVDCPH